MTNYIKRPDLSDDIFTVFEDVGWIENVAQRFHIAMSGVSRCARNENQVATQIEEMRRIHGAFR